MPPSAPGEVHLREVSEPDLPILFEQQRDPVAVQMAAFTAKDPANWDTFLAHWKKILADASMKMRTITYQGHVVGFVGSWVDSSWLGQPEVTYWIGRGFWGQGIATRALTQFLKGMKHRPVYARAAKDNLPSIRVLEKCGFILTGQDTSYSNARGAEIEEVILRLE